MTLKRLERITDQIEGPIKMGNQRINKYEYPPFKEWKWKSYDRKKVINLEEWVEEMKNRLFFIGTDSQTYGKKCVFTTCLIAYEMGRGGTVILHSDKTEKFDSLRQRLLMEAFRSLDTAWFVDGRIPKETKVAIHLDVNENLRYKSARYKEELVGMIIGQGFEASWKPNAWGAQSVADRVC